MRPERQRGDSILPVVMVVVVIGMMTTETGREMLMSGLHNIASWMESAQGAVTAAAR